MINEKLETDSLMLSIHSFHLQVAPSVPCSIITPIAPLSLSFRPLVIPEQADILIHLPEVARWEETTTRAWF
jgi:NAD+ kinase